MLLAATIVCCAAQITFEEQRLPNFADYAYIEYSDVIEISPSQHDFDGDGYLDLLLANGMIALQRDGLFPEDARVAQPDLPEGAYRLWAGGMIHHFEGSRMQSWALRDGEWATVLETQFGWPSAELNHIDMRDLNDDGSPEVLWIDSDRIEVFALEEGSYAKRASWALPLDIRRHHVLPSDITPAEERRPIQIMESMSFALRFENGAFTLEYTAANEKPGTNRFIHVRFPFDTETLAVSEDNIEVRQSSHVAMDEVRDFSANEDDRIDLIRTEFERTIDPQHLVPHTKIDISTDGGETTTHFRSRFTDALSPVADVNNDGRKDIVLHHTMIAEGGMREAIARSATRTEIQHRIDIHLQDAQAGFPRRPTFSTKLAIDLERPLVTFPKMLDVYLSGGIISVQGDIDGDGFNDLVYMDRRDRFVVRRGSPNGFEDSIAASQTIDGVSWISVADVNGDGLDDVLVELYAPEDRDEIGSLPMAVYLSRAKP